MTSSPSILNSLSRGVSLLGQNIQFFVLFTIISVLISLGSTTAAVFYATQTGPISLLMTLSTFALQYFIYGAVSASLKMVAGEKPPISHLFQPIHKFARFYVGNIFLGLALALGFIFFFIPGVYVFVKYIFVPFLLADEDIGVRAAWDKSGKLSKGNGFQLLLLFIIICVLTIISWFLMLTEVTVVTTTVLIFNVVSSAVIMLALADLLKQIKATSTGDSQV